MGSTHTRMSHGPLVTLSLFCGLYLSLPLSGAHLSPPKKTAASLSYREQLRAVAVHGCRVQCILLLGVRCRAPAGAACGHAKVAFDTGRRQA